MTAPQSKASDPSGGDNPRRDRQSESMSRMLNRTLSATTFHPHRARRGIDAHALYEREIDHQAIVAAAKPGAVMTAAANCGEQLLLPPEAHGGDHIRHIRATCNEQRPLVDHSII